MMGTYQVESVNVKAVMFNSSLALWAHNQLDKAGSTLPHPAPHVFQIILFCFYLAFKL